MLAYTRRRHKLPCINDVLFRMHSTFGRLSISLWHPSSSSYINRHTHIAHSTKRCGRQFYKFISDLILAFWWKWSASFSHLRAVQEQTMRSWMFNTLETIFVWADAKLLLLLLLLGRHWWVQSTRCHLWPSNTAWGPGIMGTTPFGTGF